MKRATSRARIRRAFGALALTSCATGCILVTSFNGLSEGGGSGGAGSTGGAAGAGGAGGGAGTGGAGTSGAGGMGGRACVDTPVAASCGAYSGKRPCEGLARVTSATNAVDTCGEGFCSLAPYVLTFENKQNTWRYYDCKTLPAGAASHPFSATLRAGWSPEALYVYVLVEKDTSVWANPGANIPYYGDAVEVFVGRPGTVTSDKVDVDSIHLILQPPDTIGGPAPRPGGPPALDDGEFTARRLSDTSYAVELVLKWSHLGYAPKQFDQIHFDVGVDVMYAGPPEKSQPTDPPAELFQGFLGFCDPSVKNCDLYCKALATIPHAASDELSWCSPSLL